MAEVTRDESNENIINVGSNYRIEPGPALNTAIATEELLSDARTAPHYHAGNVDRMPGFDALGKPIKIGEEMTYLEHGGLDHPGKRVFYVYEKEMLNIDDPNSPHYVPQHIRDANAESDNRTYYDYRWKEIATRATEEAAIDFAQRRAAD